MPEAEPPLFSCSSRVSSEERQPALERRDAQSPFEPGSVAPGQIEQRVGLGDAQPLGAGQDLDDLVAGLDLALLEHAKIKARPVMRDEQRRHSRLVHPDADPVAGDARLRHLEQRAADPVAVADADLGVGQALDGEILAELAVNEVVAAKLSLPVAIGLDLIDEDRAMLAAMAGEIALAIPVEVEPPRHPGALNRRFPDAGMDRSALPGDIAREPDIERKQARHLILVAGCGGALIGSRPGQRGSRSPPRRPAGARRTAPAENKPARRSRPGPETSSIGRTAPAGSPDR